MPTPLSPAEQTAAAKDFAAFWQGKGYEKGQTQPFWLDLLRLLGVENPSAFIEFEDAARMDEAHGFIDAFIPSTHVLVEQKSLGRDLRAPIRQSDGTLLTPFQQARRYSASLPYSQRPRWIVTCNFAEFHVYDMENPNAEPESIRLADLPDDLYRLRFLVNAASDRVAREMEVSIEAGRIVGRIYDALLAQYGDPTPEVLHWLNVLCVRLVFCLYAEDAGIFADDQFHDYLAAIPTHRLRQALLDLFATLDTKPEDRSRYLDPGLAAFPYVNGSLFAGPVEIPQFTEDLRAALLEKASLGFDWSEISPTIFGAVFESTLNPETRRSGGMHYTSIENIHKVVDPLFLDALRAELDAALVLPVPRQRDAALLAYQQKLASLTFLDPACGSGNFLTETYLSLRRLENQAIAARYKGQGVLGLVENPIRVSIHQFHGIEINDFAVSVAKTALWIADSQMLAETAQIVRLPLHFLPLESYDGIVEGNALRMDWRELCSSPSMRVEKSNVEKLKSTADLSTSQPFNLSTGFDYIMGNPPFIGASMMTAEQKAEAVAIFGKGKRVNSIDYVGAWYHKAAALMQGTSTRAAFVSTNSITQGEQVAPLWRPLVEKFGLRIEFAHRTFRWDSESNEKAHVHCVIIGFSCWSEEPLRPLYDGERYNLVPHINPYLLPAPDAFVEPRSTPLCEVPPMTYGNKPSDGGNLILSESEATDLLRETPAFAPFIRRYVGSRDFIRSDEIRHCLWLKDAPPSLLHTNREVMRRLAAVRDFRLASTAAPTRALADQPWRFFATPQTEENYLAIPEVSSSRRRYIPIGFLDARTIASNKLLIVPSASLYHFGILISNVHMAWTRAVAGRLKSDYQYSAAIVYNNFPWPGGASPGGAGGPPANSASEPPAPPAWADRIAATARAILSARAAHPDATLADLYDPLTMPPNLLDAHRANDRAVMTAYGFDLKMAESDCVAELFKLYQRLAATP